MRELSLKFNLTTVIPDFDSYSDAASNLALLRETYNLDYKEMADGLIKNPKDGYESRAEEGLNGHDMLQIGE